MANPIKVVRTKIGELFIGEYDEEQQKLYSSYTLQVIPVNQSSFNIMLLPVFVPISKEVVDLDLKDNILAITSPNQDLENQYISAKTNIVVAKNVPDASNLIVGE